MANKIVLKKSSVAAKVPLTTDLDYGELALNYADEKLYFKNSSNVVKSFTAFNATQSTLTIGTGLSGTSYNGTSAVTIAIDSTVATLTGTQTLTNKTISGASNTLSNIGNSSLTNSTISGVALGGSLNNLTAGTGLSGTAYNGSAAQTWTLATSGVTAGSYGSSTAIPVLSIDTYGRVTSASTSSITVGDGTLTVNTSGTGLSGSGTFSANQSTASTITITSNATSANTASTIVARDASGNFTAGTITAALSGNASTSTKLATARTLSLSGDVTGSVTFDGSADVAITAVVGDNTHSHSIDTISDEHRLFNNMGDNHATRTSFDATAPSYNFGWRFVQGYTNGPGVNSAGQYYSLYAGLGNDYGATGAGSYGMQLAIPRNVTSPYIAVRYNENNSLGAWQKISAGYADTAGGVAWANVSDKPDPVVTVTLTGDVTGTGNTTLTDLASGTISFATTIAANSVALGTDTTGNYVASIATTSPLSGGATGSEGGTLTLSLASGYGDNQNPYGSKTANHFLAAPNGTAGNPTFRAIVAADIPTLNQSTTGNAATATTLQTARTINTVSFNGSANIVVEPYVESDESTNATRYITFVDSSTDGHQRLNEDSNFTINPSTGTVTTNGAFASIFSLNKNTIDTSYSIPSGYNATSAGPVVINNGITVTIPTGSTWVIV